MLGSLSKRTKKDGFLSINVVGTHNLIEACLYNGIKRVMFALSSSVYGNAMYTPMDEEHPFNNKNHYGASKIACEALFKAFHHSDEFNL